MGTQRKQLTVAVIGAGMAGAACARALALVGHSVRVFDKARGPGGRLATRRVAWVDRHGQTRQAQFDHGAVGFTARSPSFQRFAAQAVQAGWLTEWTPTLGADSLPLENGGSFYLPVPDMPAPCRRQLDGAIGSWSYAVEALHKGPHGWQVETHGERLGEQFDAVVLALPPAQAAPLLSAHRRDWAESASLVLMEPCWTLMGVADAPDCAPDHVPDWDLVRPPQGILAWAMRNDARPGRQREPGQAHWVLHARAGWSRQHLEQSATWVQSQMQAALAERLGRPVEWRQCAVHRWRYAVPHRSGAAPAGHCWWDAAQGLGVCGDFLGSSGVEGAWLSARSLAAALLASLTPEVAPTTPDRFVAPVASAAQDPALHTAS